MTAGGRTPSDVAKDIQDKLGLYVRDPQVAVILTEMKSHEYLSRVGVTGAVRQPDLDSVPPGHDGARCGARRGRPHRFAAPDRSDLYRKEGNGTRSYAVRLDRILSRGDLSTNFKVAPGDVITVPERAL